MIEKIVDIVVYAGIVQGFFLALLLHRRTGAARGPNRVLSALLIVLSLAIVHSVFVAGRMEHLMGNPIKIKEPFILLIGPMLYLYARQLIGSETKFKGRDLFHLAPFLLFFALNLPFFVHDGGSPYTRFFTSNAASMGVIAWVFVVLQYGAYLVAITRLTHVSLRRAREEFSNTEDVDISWVRFFMIIFLALFVFLMVVLVSLVHFGGFVHFGRTVSLIFSLSIFALGYKGLFQKGIFLQPAEPATEAQAPLARPLATQQDDATARRIIEYVEEKKPYLNPDLTLTALAQEVGVSRNQLSEIINAQIGTNFYDFINKYRVEEVKRLLTDPKMKVIKIIAIAFEAGFPSKSSFNNTFKKWTGLTPSEYRDRLR